MAENPDKSEKVCPRCGKKNKQGRKYCAYCDWILDVVQKPDC